MAESAQHTKTISWVDPRPQAAQALTMTGLDYLRAMMDGTIPPPPIASHINLEMLDATPGVAIMAATPDDSHYNPIGSVHGGFVCTALDSAAGCAVQTTLPAGTGYTSLEIKVNYLRAVSATTGALTVVGTVTKPGSRVAFAEAVVLDGQGRTVATASSTLLVFPVPAA